MTEKPSSYKEEIESVFGDNRRIDANIIARMASEGNLEGASGWKENLLGLTDEQSQLLDRKISDNTTSEHNP